MSNPNLFHTETEEVYAPGMSAEHPNLQPGIQPHGYYPQYGQHLPIPRPTNGWAIAGFILGVLGLGFLIPVIGWFSVPLVILALVFSILGLRRASYSDAPYRGLALAGLVLAALSLLVGTILNAVVFHRADSLAANWSVAQPLAVPPSGAQAEAAIGEWSFNGVPWFRFLPNGIVENLQTHERFNWHENGTFTNTVAVQNWHVDNNIMTIDWFGGQTFTYERHQ